LLNCTADKSRAGIICIAAFDTARFVTDNARPMRRQMLLPGK
jgi:hypothetical protein